MLEKWLLILAKLVPVMIVSIDHRLGSAFLEPFPCHAYSVWLEIPSSAVGSIGAEVVPLHQGTGSEADHLVAATD